MICNFTNAIFFWAFLPETKGIPLEEMKILFQETPWFVPGSKRRVVASELAVATQEIEEKRATVVHTEAIA